MRGRNFRLMNNFNWSLSCLPDAERLVSCVEAQLLCQHVYQSKTTDKKTFDEVEVSLVHSPVKPTLARELARKHGSFEDVYFSCIEHGDVPLFMPGFFLRRVWSPSEASQVEACGMCKGQQEMFCFVFPSWRSWSYVMFKVHGSRVKIYVCKAIQRWWTQTHHFAGGVPWGNSDFWILISNLKRIAHWKHTNASISHFDPNEPPKISQTIWRLSNIPKSSGNNDSQSTSSHIFHIKSTLSPKTSQVTSLSPTAFHYTPGHFKYLLLWICSRSSSTRSHEKKRPFCCRA